MNNAPATAGSWADTTVASFQNVWSRLINVLPLLLAAIVVFIIGMLVARLVSRLLQTGARKMGFDQVIERTGVTDRIREGGIAFSASGFLGSLGYWIVMLITLTVVADTLHWTMLGDFLRRIVAFTPTLLVAMAILVVGFLAARLVHDLVEGSIRASGMNDSAAETVASIARVSVIVFACMAALTQIGVAEDLIRILFAGMVAAAALGIGLAFGLGGREPASRLLDRMSNEMSSPSSPMNRPARAARH